MILRLTNGIGSANLDPTVTELLEESEFLNNGQATCSTPALNVYEDEEGYIIELAAPGRNREDFNIRVKDRIVTISAETEVEEDEEDSEGDYIHREYSYDSFSRSFELPDDAVEEEIEASYEDGELILSIPKDTAIIDEGYEIEID